MRATKSEDTKESDHELNVPLRKEGSPEEVFEGTSKDKDAWTSRVPLAPQWASLYSLALYLYLWGTGWAHLYREIMGVNEPKLDRVYGDFALLCSAYICESVYALIFKKSTMNGWRYVDFAVHHVPFVVVSCLGLLVGVPIQLYRFTTPLCLLTSLNEAIAAARALGAPKSLDIPNRFYLLALMGTLAVAETTEALMCIFIHDLSLPCKVMAAISLLAPCYHTYGVMPHCWKVVNKWTRQQLGYTSAVVVKAPAVKAE